MLSKRHLKLTPILTLVLTLVLIIILTLTMIVGTHPRESSFDPTGFDSRASHNQDDARCYPERTPRGLPASGTEGGGVR